MSYYEILNGLIAIIILLSAIYYVYDWSKGHDRKPALWVALLKADRIPPKLRKLYRTYPDKDRFMIFWLQLNRLDEDKVPGAIAELGVYRGQTAELLHHLSPERELHLFDTFRGFLQDDLRLETGEAASYTSANFADTSLEFVKTKLGEYANIIYHQGNFSETALSLINPPVFALVTIDVDLEKPTAEGLNYFYPLLAPGGVMIVHDYNPKWPGLMNAVDAFLQKIPETPVLMPDRNSSLIIVKNGIL
ncbi:MAG: TylF/MycF/NovP-related O-methyltransferase [Bacteroidales bacterium]|nr:TylF/MycF/NovP-related O-methyltransferase [Bacteroidales bacterium]